MTRPPPEPLLRLRRPDDLHLHLRDGAMLAAVLPHTARAFGRAIVMPNLVPPVTTTAAAAAYRARVVAALPPGARFEPLMTLYLTDHTDPDDVERGVREGIVRGVKLYPAGATTHAEAGVTDLRHTRRVLERLERLGTPLLVHGEVTRPDVDVFDREARFLEEQLGPLLARHPGLRVVVEHATTGVAVDFVRAHGERVGCTITPQHLLVNRNDLLVGGIKPHLYCLPVLKTADDQRRLVEAATSGDPSFFLGTDSAPHAVHTKECASGCAGCFTAPCALELYAEVFDRAGALPRLEGFASLHGPRFYGLEPHADTVVLRRESWEVPARVPVGDGTEVVPFHAGRRLAWRLDPTP